jgi:DNA-binding transcriptional ArsR family regulator
MIGWLRAAGEPTRLRLLALCAQAGLSVSDLARALRQSEPRISRHLKILSEAGLIERQRQGQWVHYRVSAGAEASSFIAGLLAQLDRRDETLQRDRSAARTAQPPARATGPTESRLGRALAALIVPGDAQAALVVGVTHPELIASVAAGAGSCVALAHSRRAAQAVRAFGERSGFRCRVLEVPPGPGLREADIGRLGGPFDLILLDQPAADATALASVLEVAHRLLSARGRLWLFEGYEALEGAGQRVVEHPLARLRRLLSEAGFVCERLSPLEADGEHVLAAAARPAPAQHSRGAGVA